MKRGMPYYAAWRNAYARLHAFRMRSPALAATRFLVICPDTNSDDAFKCAERLRDLVAASPIVVGEQSVDVTISLGVATFGEGAKNISDLMAQADQALQLAKGAGRNRAFIWTDAQGS